MKKSSLLLSFFVGTLFLPFVIFSQEAEWVEQVIVASGNQFESTPPFIDFVTVRSYNPTTAVNTVFDQIKTQSVQDVAIKNGKIYVAAQDSIVMYDANTLQRLAAVLDSGLSRLYVLNNRLIVSKQYPVVKFFVEVLNANDLSLIARIPNISGECKGITHYQDSIYVAVNGGFLSTEGKMAVISSNNWTLKREINFGPNAVGINDIHNYDRFMFSVNETPFGSSGVGSITAYDTYSKTYNNYIINYQVGNGAGGVLNSGIIDTLLFLTLNNGIGSFNLDTRLLQDSIIFPDPGTANHIYYTSYATDYLNSRLYINVGNRVSWGKTLVGSATGDSITSFQTGFNSDALAIDYRVPVGIDNQVAGEEKIALYPNPVENILRIKYTGSDQVKGILIRDITGRIVYQDNNEALSATWLDCSFYSAGLYFVTVKTSSKTISTKFIKK